MPTSHSLKLSRVENLKGGQALPIPRPQLRASYASRGTYFGLWRKACQIQVLDTRKLQVQAFNSSVKGALSLM